jgi:hypothetical protein
MALMVAADLRFKTLAEFIARAKTKKVANAAKVEKQERCSGYAGLVSTTVPKHSSRSAAIPLSQQRAH